MSLTEHVRAEIARHEQALELLRQLEAQAQAFDQLTEQWRGLATSNGQPSLPAPTETPSRHPTPPGAEAGQVDTWPATTETQRRRPTEPRPPAATDEVLRIVTDQGPISQKEISETLGIASSTTSVACRVLADRGAIEPADASDGRQRIWQTVEKRVAAAPQPDEESADVDTVADTVTDTVVDVAFPRPRHDDDDVVEAEIYDADEPEPAAPARRAAPHPVAAKPLPASTSARPTGERLRTIVLKLVQGEPMDLRAIAKNLVLPQDEIAQALNHLTQTDQVTRADDGVYHATT